MVSEAIRAISGGIWPSVGGYGHQWGDMVISEGGAMAISGGGGGGYGHQ